jgi:hypothetical protein
MNSALFLASEIPQYCLLYQIYFLGLNKIEDGDLDEATSYTYLFICISLLKSAKYLLQYSSLIFDVYAKKDNG